MVLKKCVLVPELLHLINSTSKMILFVNKIALGAKLIVNPETIAVSILNVKQFNSNVRKNSFSVRVINPWNSLPDYAKESKILNIFKNSYDDHVRNVEHI